MCSIKIRKKKNGIESVFHYVKEDGKDGDEEGK